MSEVDSPQWAAENKGQWILVTCWVVTAISTIFVLARIYVRGFLQRKFQQDDVWVIIAQVCGYISTGLSTAAVASGNGQHFSLLSVEQKQSVILWTTAAFCPGVISFGLPKLAVVYLLTKLLNPSRLHKYFLWWMGIWCQLTLFATVGILLGKCTPARSLWDFSVKGKCIDNNILVSYCLYAGSFSAFVDIYLAIYPTIVLYGLQMSIKKKVALCIALGIGLVSGIVAIYKSTRIPSLGSADYSYDTSDLVVWTVIEGSTIIIACSIPILQPLLEKILRYNPFASSVKKSHDSSDKYHEDRSNPPIYELGVRKPPMKAKDELGFTILSDDGDSEEGILAMDAQSQYQQSTFVVSSPTPPDDQHNQNPSFPDEPTSTTARHWDTRPVNIVRTDTVTIIYDRTKRA